MNHGFVGLWIWVLKMFVYIFSVWDEGENFGYIYIYILGFKS